MLKSDYVFSLFVDSEGNLWIGCLDGDMACFPSGKNVFRGVEKAAFYLPVNEVQCITESEDKRSIAVGTSHGCYLIDKREPLHPRRFFYPEQYPDKDINLFVNSMVYQNSRHVWPKSILPSEVHATDIRLYSRSSPLKKLRFTTFPL